jgi:hypothetical protein
MPRVGEQVLHAQFDIQLASIVVQVLQGELKRVGGGDVAAERQCAVMSYRPLLNFQ